MARKKKPGKPGRPKGGMRSDPDYGKHHVTIRRDLWKRLEMVMVMGDEKVTHSQMLNRALEFYLDDVQMIDHDAIAQGRRDRERWQTREPAGEESAAGEKPADEKVLCGLLDGMECQALGI